MPHPHGQMYGYSFIPKKLQLETASAKEYYEKTGNCLFCDTLKNELEAQKAHYFPERALYRVTFRFYCEYPYGVYIMANRHVQYITDLTEEEKYTLGATIRDTVGMLDSLFDYRFPYMMCMHNAPVNSGDYSKDFHFHIEFFPPMRSADKQKFNASSEPAHGRTATRPARRRPPRNCAPLTQSSWRARRANKRFSRRKPGGNGPLRTHR